MNNEITMFIQPILHKIRKLDAVSCIIYENEGLDTNTVVMGRLCKRRC